MPLDINTLNVRVNLQPTPPKSRAASGASEELPGRKAPDAAPRLAAQMRMLLPLLRDNLTDRLDR